MKFKLKIECKNKKITKFVLKLMKLFSSCSLVAITTFYANPWFNLDKSYTI